MFDLHDHGLFNTRPFVTQDWAYRIIVDEALKANIQYLCLEEKQDRGSQAHEQYNFTVSESIITLDDTLTPNHDDVLSHIQNETVFNDLIKDYNEWRNGYVPVNNQSGIDLEGLRKKLRASVEDRKTAIRRELTRKNNDWINTALPRLIQDFQYGLYTRVEDHLYNRYRKMGGQSEGKDLIRKIMTFYRIYENKDNNPMIKPNGKAWKDEDEIWDCWVGFAGAEDEAVRVCRTMESVFRPLGELESF